MSTVEKTVEQMRADQEERVRGYDAGGNPDFLEPIPGQQDMSGGETPAAPQAPLEGLQIEGTQQMSLDVGGKRPQTASLKLTGGSIDLVEGTFFRKGDRIHFSGTAVVNDWGQRDKHDTSTGQVVSAVEKYGARITDLWLAQE